MKEKILRLIHEPSILVFLWFAFLLSPLLSFFRFYFMVKNDILKIHITSLSTLFLYFPFFISTVVFFILIFWFKRFIDKKASGAHQKTLVFLSISSVVFLVIARSLLVLEQRNYPNFLYGHFGLTVSQLETMSFVAALELFVFLFMLAYNRTFKLSKQNRLERNNGRAQMEIYSLILALVGLSGLIILSIYPFVNWSRLYGEVKGGFESRVGVHYKYIVLLAENTPTDVKIIHPPQGEKWPAIGNQPVLRYFLYPRVLISGALLDNQEFAMEIGSAYFVEIDTFSGLTHWPKIDERSKTIIFDESTEIKYKAIDTVFKSDEGSVYLVYF